MTLPVPVFVEQDPVAVEREIVAQFEQLTGRSLQPAQVERLLLQLVAYRESLVRAQIQYAAEQQLLAFARYPMLDYMGELYGVARLGPQPAETTIRFTLAGVQAEQVLIPAGTRVRTTDGRITFATVAALVIAAGQLTGDIRAVAQELGVSGNGYLPGEASVILDPVAGVAAAANLAQTAGGADQETDDRLRARIRQAPASFSVAGSKGAYRFHALTASAAITDVAVSSPEPGVVRVDVLTSTGLPSAEILEAVELALGSETVRPLTDTVIVAEPVARTYAIAATIEVLRGHDAATVLAQARAAADAYMKDRSARLGQDIIPSQIIAALSVPGAYVVELAQPAAKIIVAPGEWAQCTGVVITDGGTVDG